ncbi:MAG: PTS sugar transporter subunit IIB [Erysipelotrichaceae bacterium]|nr:PTS sugar transporter subunit IIB [Erysipelotrichaceae bacterium]MDD3810442.1 PTS sugar transporter subunit IIB [Erysipelotrichaceae bacterium]
MKILLVCAGGMSTSILMKKMEKYWKENGENLDIKAVGLSEYQDVYQNFDIVMMGPQVSYRLKEVKENTGLPTAAIESFDYAIANCPNIMKLAKKLYAEI